MVSAGLKWKLNNAGTQTAIKSIMLVKSSKKAGSQWMKYSFFTNYWRESAHLKAVFVLSYPTLLSPAADHWVGTLTIRNKVYSTAPSSLLVCCLRPIYTLITVHREATKWCSSSFHSTTCFCDFFNPEDIINKVYSLQRLMCIHLVKTLFLSNQPTYFFLCHSLSLSISPCIV